MAFFGVIKNFRNPEVAVQTLRSAGFKPHYDKGQLQGWKRVDPESHHLITATTETLPSGRVRVQVVAAKGANLRIA